MRSPLLTPRDYAKKKWLTDADSYYKKDQSTYAMTFFSFVAMVIIVVFCYCVAAWDDTPPVDKEGVRDTLRRSQP